MHYWIYPNWICQKRWTSVLFDMLEGTNQLYCEHMAKRCKGQSWQVTNCKLGSWTNLVRFSNPLTTGHSSFMAVGEPDLDKLWFCHSELHLMSASPVSRDISILSVSVLLCCMPAPLYVSKPHLKRHFNSSSFFFVVCFNAFNFLQSLCLSQITLTVNVLPLFQNAFSLSIVTKKYRSL